MGSYATGGLDKLKESMCGLFCGEQLFRILLKSTDLRISLVHVALGTRLRLKGGCLSNAPRISLAWFSLAFVAPFWPFFALV